MPAESRARFLIEKLDDMAADLGDLNVVEVGTVRHPDWEYGDGHSTVKIARWIKETRAREFEHRFFSIDVRTAMANVILKKAGLRDCVELIEDNGVDAIKDLHLDIKRIDFLYLDGSDSPREAYLQFMAAFPLLHELSLIAIDDCNPGTKGDLLLPAARAAVRDIEWLDKIALLEFGDRDDWNR